LDCSNCCSGPRAPTARTSWAGLHQRAAACWAVPPSAPEFPPKERTRPAPPPGGAGRVRSFGRRSPLVMHLVPHRRLLSGPDLHREDDRAGVELLEVVAVLRQVPLAAAVHLLQHLDGHVLLLVVADLDLEALLVLAVRDLLEVRLLALADDVERVAGVQHHL